MEVDPNGYGKGKTAREARPFFSLKIITGSPVLVVPKKLTRPVFGGFNRAPGSNQRRALFKGTGLPLKKGK